MATYDLNEKESIILFLITLGKCDKEIAAIINHYYGSHISRDAITKVVIRNLYPKFNVVNRGGLIMLAYRRGFINKFPTYLSENLLNLKT